VGYGQKTSMDGGLGLFLGKNLCKKVRQNEKMLDIGLILMYILI
jgi:hypothetical protein